MGRVFYVLLHLPVALLEGVSDDHAASLRPRRAVGVALAREHLLGHV